MKKFIFFLLIILAIFQMNLHSAVNAQQPSQYLVKPAIIIPKNITQPTNQELDQYKTAIIQSLQQVQQFYSSKLQGHTFNISPSVTVINSPQNLDPTLYSRIDSVNVIEGQMDCESNTVKITWILGSQNLTTVGGSFFMVNPRRPQPCGFALLNHNNLNELMGLSGAGNKDYALGFIAHELGHGFDLIFAGFAKGHPCAQTREIECEPNAPIPLPPPSESQNDMMHYIGSPLSTRIINNTTHNPEIWKLFQRPFINPNGDPAPPPTGSVRNLQVSNISPTSVNQGEIVTINGQEFGPTRGSVQLLNPSYATGSMQNFTINSWSDNQIQIQINKDALSLTTDTSWQVKVISSDGTKNGTFDSLIIKGNSPPPQIVITVLFSLQCGGTTPVPGVKVDLATTNTQPVVSLASTISNSSGAGQISYTVINPVAGQKYYIVPATISGIALPSTKNFVIPTPAPSILNIADSVFNYQQCPANLLSDLTLNSSSIIDPDLSDPLTEGELVSFSAVVSNAGTANAPESTTNFAVDNRPLCSDNTGLLKSGASEMEVCQNAWAATSGIHTLTVCADATSTISESNESNDCLARVFNVASVIVPTNPPTSKVTLQGVRINSSHNYFDPGTIITAGVNDSSSGSNPYTLQTNAGLINARTTVPAGYNVSYSLCLNTTDSSCHSSFTSGNSVNFNLTQGYADIWWMYNSLAPTPTPPTNLHLSASPAPTCDPNNRRAVTLAWDPLPQAHSFKVEKQAPGQYINWTFLAITSSSIYTDLSSPGQGYNYKVTAYEGTNGSGITINSQTVSNINVALCSGGSGTTAVGPGGACGLASQVCVTGYFCSGSTRTCLSNGNNAPTSTPVPTSTQPVCNIYVGSGFGCGGSSKQCCNAGLSCSNFTCTGSTPTYNTPPYGTPYTVPLTTISGHVYVDNNGNGSFDSGEGFNGAGVTITEELKPTPLPAQGGCVSIPGFFTCPSPIAPQSPVTLISGQTPQPNNGFYSRSYSIYTSIYGANIAPGFTYTINLSLPTGYKMVNGTSYQRIVTNAISGTNPAIDFGIVPIPTPSPIPAPTCSFTGPIRLTTRAIGTYTSRSTGQISSYSWTSTPIGGTFTAPIAASTNWSASIARTYIITLTVTGPGGSSSCSNGLYGGTIVVSPTPIPTAIPTLIPTKIPTWIPTIVPTTVPTRVPQPTAVPTPIPTAIVSLSCSTLTNLVLNSYNSSCGDTKYDKRADLDKNKTVNSQDYSTALSASNQGASGADVCKRYLDNQTNPCPAPTPLPLIPAYVTINGQTKTIAQFKEQPFTMHLPGTIGTPQTFSIPVKVTYTNGSSKTSNWTFSYQPPITPTQIPQPTAGQPLAETPTPGRSGPTAIPRAGATFPLSGLVSYWKLDEAGGTTTTDSLGSNPGTLAGTVGSLQGKLGNAKSFIGSVGNSNINIGNKTNLNLTTFTISGWFYRTGTCSYSTCPILSKGQGSNTGYSLEVLSSDGKAVLNIRDSLNVAKSNTVLAANTWYHVAGSIDGSRIKLYINGVLEADVAQTEIPTFWTNAPAMIGSRNGGEVTMNGYIDEVGIWNRALTGGEVSALYNSGNGLGL